MKTVEQLKKQYIEEKNILDYIDYLIETYETVDVVPDLSDIIQLVSDIEDFNIRYHVQRVIALIYHNFEYVTGITMSAVETNGKRDCEFKFSYTDWKNVFDSHTVKINLSDVREMDEEEIQEYFEIGLAKC